LARGQRLGMRATDQWATLLAIVRGGVTALCGDANFLKLVYAAFEQPGDRGSHLLRDHGEICGSSRRDTVASLTIK
jgi:hypothetical protein